MERCQRCGESHDDDEHTTECAYCLNQVPCTDEMPAVDDDAAWERIAKDHGAGCEWVETRAHNLDADPETRIRKYWVAAPPSQGQLGSWPVDTPDETILAELLAECGTDEDEADIRAGEIKTGPWTE